MALVGCALKVEVGVNSRNVGGDCVCKNGGECRFSRSESRVSSFVACAG